MHHGSRDGISLYIGLCLTDDADLAAHYGRTIDAVELDLAALTVAEAPAYDRETNEAPGDTEEQLAAYAALGIDVLVFMDETPRGRTHRTWRIASSRGLAAVRVVVEEEE